MTQTSHTPLPAIDLERLLGDLETLATFVEPHTPGATRRFPSAAYIAGRAWLRERMEQAGLRTWIDAGGNLFGLLPGARDLPPIVAGSHTDTVMGGGIYDGALGVLGALEVARCLAESGTRLRHPLLVADFLAEEANDFGVSCIGSRSLAYGLEAAWLERTLNGQTLAQALSTIGGDPGGVAAPLLKPGAFSACLELHIEQGPTLETAGAILGAVSGIIGIRRGTFTLAGQPDHAGTAPMALRHDALTAAAELILAVERCARAEAGAVGTVGRLALRPNQSNVVPGEVTLTAEVRHLDPAAIALVWDYVLEAAEAACAERGVTLLLDAHTDAEPAAPPPWLLSLVSDVCRRLDPRALVLPSGAGHDTGHLAHLAPAAMIFVPSAGGRSHCPEEYTAPEHLRAGVTALLHAVAALDAREAPSQE